MPQTQDRLEYYPVTLGCDPELFFTKGGKVIGSEKVIPIEGLVPIDKYGGASKGSKIVRDGVQAELNPQAKTCRVFLSQEISLCFQKLLETMKEKNDPELNIDFTQTIKIDKEELASLSPENQILGCSPSKNAYNKRNFLSVKNGSKYYYRSAGGHIHLGKISPSYGGDAVNNALDNHKTLIPLLDIVLGNTCVLLDRDPGNIQRRKVYGRAGEYRTPKHGVEYRTLSNFWLRNYQLTSFVMGLARETVLILANSNKKHNYAKEIIKAVKRTEIKRAINKNDFDLALSNFQKIEPILSEITRKEDKYNFPLTKGNIKEFLFFAQKGLDFWFNEDPLKHWTQPNIAATGGWESFLDRKVHPIMEKELVTVTPQTA